MHHFTLITRLIRQCHTAQMQLAVERVGLDAGQAPAVVNGASVETLQNIVVPVSFMGLHVYSAGTDSR